MATNKTKRKRSKQGLLSKVINTGLVAFGFSRVLTLLFAHGFSQASVTAITREATFGLSSGSFDLNAGLRMYTPAGGAAALGYLKSYLMRKFPVRRG